MAKHWIQLNNLTDNIIIHNWTSEFPEMAPATFDEANLLPEFICIDQNGPRHSRLALFDEHISDYGLKWESVNQKIVYRRVNPDIAYITASKEKLLDKLAECTNSAIAPIYNRISKAESDSWSAKGAEYDAYVLNNTASCPILTMEATLRGFTLQDYITLKVEPKVLAYRKFVAALVAAQAETTNEIQALTTYDEVRAYDTSLNETFLTRLATFNQ